MHVHASQFNPNAQMNAIYAARAEAGMAAARTRRKLIFSASALANEVDGETDCVVSLSGEDASRDQSNQQDSSERIRWEQAKPSDRRREQSFLGLGITRRRSRLWREGTMTLRKRRSLPSPPGKLCPLSSLPVKVCESLGPAILTSVYPTASELNSGPGRLPAGAILAEPCKSL